MTAPVEVAVATDRDAVRKKKRVEHIGDLLADAQVRIDSRFNEPYVAITFNPVGAKRFDQITAAIHAG